MDIITIISISILIVTTFGLGIVAGMLYGVDFSPKSFSSVCPEPPPIPNVKSAAEQQILERYRLAKENLANEKVCLTTTSAKYKEVPKNTLKTTKRTKKRKKS